jgi:hypothetical protein
VLNWKDLIITDSDGSDCQLSRMVEEFTEEFDTATIRDGKIVEWPHRFISGPPLEDAQFVAMAEENCWEIPEADWSGFETALNAKRQLKSKDVVQFKIGHEEPNDTCDPRNPKRPEGCEGDNWVRCRNCGRSAVALRLIRHTKLCRQESKLVE